jgi:ABC-type branched-subunit amino acid transport system permease subunit
MVILGGTGTLGGAVLGAAAFILLQSLVSTYTERWMLILGVDLRPLRALRPGRDRRRASRADRDPA